MFWLWALCFAAIMIALPFVRFFLKRIVFLFKIKRLCKKKGYRLSRRRLFWFLAVRNRNDYDFTVNNGACMIQVKLFGIIRKNTKLYIKENGDCFIRKYYTFLSSKNHASMAILFTDSKPKKLKDFYFTEENNHQRKVLLVHPACLEVIKQPKHGSEQLIDNGDFLYGMEIFSAKSFLNKGI